QGAPSSAVFPGAPLFRSSHWSRRPSGAPWSTSTASRSAASGPGPVGAPVADARHRGARVFLVLLGGDLAVRLPMPCLGTAGSARSEEHTSELQSRENLVC